MINWDAIGAIGEVVGAVAVVITLLYLTIQLRQNTSMVQHSIRRGVLSDAMTWLDKIIENPELTELYRAGMNAEELSTNDRLRFIPILDQLFSHWNHAYTFNAFEIVDNVHIPGVLSMPGGAAYWKKAISRKHGYSPEFVAYVDKTLADIESDKNAP